MFSAAIKILKRQIRLQQRSFRDRRRGITPLLARQKNTTPPPGFEQHIALQQDIRAGYNFENKCRNISLAADKINGLQIASGQWFSFWATVGTPNRRRGFLPSRNLVNGQISEAIGGGICQVSGALYHCALLAGLEIRERHPHSMDIYEEHERFSPLGADATVVYGYKDLRFQNPFPFPIMLCLKTENMQLQAGISSPQALAPRSIQFLREDSEKYRTVRTCLFLAPDAMEELTVSRYSPLKHKNT